MRKSYCIDTSVLIDNPKSIEILRNGEENDIYLSYETVLEIDGLKKSSRVNHIAKEVIDEFIKYRDVIKILDSKKNTKDDTKILDDIESHLDYKEDGLDFIFVTNDKMLSFRAFHRGIKTQDFKDSYPYESESQRYTGFVNGPEEAIPNSFYWVDGKLWNFIDNHHTILDHENSVWSIKPRTPYQNAAMELLLSDSIDLVSIQSCAGFGKTYIALAAALEWTLQRKQFSKIFVFKHNIDVGNQKLGFLPGDMDEKLQPYFRPIYDLIIKLHEKREANRLFADPKASMLTINPQKIEFLPINFIRGMNIDDAIVILDEAQNFSRHEIKIILSRMGENVKVVCLGDVEQIDNEYLNESNNGLNWIVKAFKGLPNYGHVVLKGKHSRGKIADMVRNSKL